MQQVIIKPEYVSTKKMALIVAGFAALFWALESFLHAVIWHDGTLAVDHFFVPDTHELWMRLLVISIIVLFGVYTKHMLNRQATAEEQIKIAFAELSQIFNTSGDGMCVIDKNFNVLRINETFNTLLGVSKDGAVGKKCYEIFHGPGCNSPKCPLKLILSGEKRVECESEKTHTNGAKIPFYITATPLRTTDGELIGIVENFRDVSERKQTEAFIKNVFDSMEECLVVIDHDYRIVTANGAYCNHVNAPLDDVIGEYCYKVLYHVDKHCHTIGKRCVVRDVFETGNPHRNIYTYQDNTGNPVYIESSAYPMRDSAGKVVSAIETINDITENSKLQEQLRHAQKMKSIGTLAGGIAHDFNNILTAIIGYSEVTLMKMADDDPLRLNIKRVLEASERAVQLTQSLLLFARKQITNRRPADLNDIIRKVEKFIERVISEGIKITTVLCEGRLSIFADPGQIEQVLMNLAINARDAMPGGGLFVIETSLAELDKEFIAEYGYGSPGQYAVLSVTDTGTGMDAETKSRIFEPFFTTKEVGKGTGLGLAMVYGIIKEHDGYINVYSEPGRGAAFRIYLPIIKMTGWEEKPAIEPEHSRGGTETILVAEDEANVRELTKKVLEESGYTVIAAKDGNDAVSMFIQNKDSVQLLLFDIVMPNKDGMDAYKEIKKIQPNIECIFISGYAADVINKKGFSEDGLSYISKPVSPVNLLRKIREALDK